MKIVTYVQDGRRKPGAVVGENVVDLSPAATSVQELIEGGPGMLGPRPPPRAAGRWHPSARPGFWRHCRARYRSATVWSSRSI